MLVELVLQVEARGVRTILCLRDPAIPKCAAVLSAPDSYLTPMYLRRSLSHGKGHYCLHTAPYITNPAQDHIYSPEVQFQPYFPLSS
jgi:hypothetical protein